MMLVNSRLRFVMLTMSSLTVGGRIAASASVAAASRLYYPADRTMEHTYKTKEHKRKGCEVLDFDGAVNLRKVSLLASRELPILPG